MAMEVGATSTERSAELEEFPPHQQEKGSLPAGKLWQERANFRMRKEQFIVFNF